MRSRPTCIDWGLIMDKVWGTKEGLCAWCDEDAETSYVGVMTNGETVEYQVCDACDELSSYSVWSEGN